MFWCVRVVVQVPMKYGKRSLQVHNVTLTCGVSFKIYAITAARAVSSNPQVSPKLLLLLVKAGRPQQ